MHEWHRLSILVCGHSMGGHSTDVDHIIPMRLHLTDVWCEMVIITGACHCNVKARLLLATRNLIAAS